MARGSRHLSESQPAGPASESSPTSYLLSASKKSLLTFRSITLFCSDIYSSLLIGSKGNLGKVALALNRASNAAEIYPSLFSIASWIAFAKSSISFSLILLSQRYYALCKISALACKNQIELMLRNY